MSWFDTSGLASLAKTALKEAQKTIDKALDIKEDELTESTASDSKLPKSDLQSMSSPIAATMPHSTAMKHSLSNPTLQSASIWGSFSGSFFDNPNAGGPMKTVTTPPSSQATRHRDSSSSSSNKDSPSVHSDSGGRTSSDSVEIVTPPTTPSSSSMTSPGVGASGSTVLRSESIEVITTNTPTSDVTTPDSIALSELDPKIYPESVEIISDDNLEPEDVSLEEDSMSFDTMTESTVETIMDARKTDALTTTATPTIAAAPPLRSGLYLSLDTSVPTTISKPGKSKSALVSSVIASECADKKVPNLIEDAIMDKFGSENFDTQTQLSDSTQSFEYVQQASSTERIPSPNSSDERSDIVKITSEQNSGHTSADEVETTTSSDIEIISSPNGDSSSTNSAYCKSMTGSSTRPELQRSDAAAKKKGHCRELSEASTHSMQSDDSRFSNQSETEKLLRRISELTEILESREYKLMELGRENAQLHDRNADMRAQLDAKRKRDDCLEVHSVTEEYTQRMSALEKKFQQSIRERDGLRDQLQVVRAECAGKVARDVHDKELNEKRFLIDELKSEGEKLSIQVLQHSNIIKKLRAKEKDADSAVKRQRDQIEELTCETDRLKKSLSAKEEMERSQIDAVHKLSSDRRKLDKDASQLRSQLDDTTQKLKTVQTSLDGAKKELQQKQQSNAELSRKTESFSSLETTNQQLQQQSHQMIGELSSLRENLRRNEHGNAVKEESLRRENLQLLRRLEEQEMRAEENAQAITESTRPLVRQLESMQHTLNQRTAAWEHQERVFLERIDDMQRQLQRHEHMEQSSSDQLSAATAQLQAYEDRLNRLLSTQLRHDQIAAELEQLTCDTELRANEFRREIDTLTATAHQQAQQIDEYRAQIMELKRQLEHDRSEIVSANVMIGGGVVGATERSTGVEGEIGPRNSVAIVDVDSTVSRGDDTSPTLSVGQESLADSLSSNLWPMVSVIYFIYS